MSLLRKGHSKLLENLPMFFLASLHILHTKSPFTFKLYLIGARILQASSLILLLSL